LTTLMRGCLTSARDSRRRPTPPTPASTRPSKTFQRFWFPDDNADSPEKQADEDAAPRTGVTQENHNSPAVRLESLIRKAQATRVRRTASASSIAKEHHRFIPDRHLAAPTGGEPGTLSQAPTASSDPIVFFSGLSKHLAGR